MSTLRSKFQAKVFVECVIEFQEPFVVGQGHETGSEAFDIVTVTLKNKPIIPGSTLKGMFRAFFTRILNSMSNNDRNKLLKFLGFTRDVPIEADEDTIKKFQKADGNKKIEYIPPCPENKKCLGLVDLMFGASGFGSPLYFTNAECDTFQFHDRTHVKIDINTNKAEAHGLVTIRSANANKMIFSIVYEEMDDLQWLTKLFLFFLHLLEKSEKSKHPFFIGGWKSRGYGKCFIKLSRMRRLSVNDILKSTGGIEYNNFENFINDNYKGVVSYNELSGLF